MVNSCFSALWITGGMVGGREDICLCLGWEEKVRQAFGRLLANPCEGKNLGGFEPEGTGMCRKPQTRLEG